MARVIVVLQKNTSLTKATELEPGSVEIFRIRRISPG